MLSFTEHGAATPDTPSLVIAHGLFGSGRNWGVIAKRLSDSRRVITPDMRNHGTSPRDASHSYPDMAEDLADLITETGSPADLCGHSMGGKAAMALALTRPRLIRKLVIADIAPVRLHPQPARHDRRHAQRRSLHPHPALGRRRSTGRGRDRPRPAKLLHAIPRCPQQGMASQPRRARSRDAQDHGLARYPHRPLRRPDPVPLRRHLRLRPQANTAPTSSRSSPTATSPRSPTPATGSTPKTPARSKRPCAPSSTPDATPLFIFPLHLRGLGQSPNPTPRPRPDPNPHPHHHLPLHPDAPSL